MRVILFRGKRGDNGEWVYGSYYKHIARQISPIGDRLREEDVKHLIIQSGFADWNMPRPLTAIEVIPETVGQFTGLTDIDGIEIFEGDLFSIDYNYNWREIDNFEVVFSRSYGWILRNKDGVWFPLRDKIKYKEVIGNIHERGNDD